jgi:Flp pilus assembly protein TadD
MQLLLDRLSATSSASGEIQFFQGELYRLRAASGDDARAIAAYEKAISMGDAPAETYRSLGLVLMKARESSRARAALDRYLELRPDATDREMIHEYVKRLE